MPLPTSKSPPVPDFETQMTSFGNLKQKDDFSESNTLQFGGVNGSRSLTGGSDYSGGHLPRQLLSLPLICPGDPINDIVLSFRDGARDLLTAGVSLQSVMGSGLTDVELLFRMRRPDEEWNVPGWACEVGLTNSPSLYHFYKLTANVLLR